MEVYQPASAQVTLDNSTREFDPSYAAGPYFGSLLPRRRLRVRAIYSGGTHDLYEGFVSRDGFPQTGYQHPEQASSTIRAYDGLQWIGEQTLRAPYAAAVQATGTLGAYYPLGDALGTLAPDTEGTAHGVLSDDVAVFAHAPLIAPEGALKIPVGDSLQIPEDGAPTGTTWTLEFWVMFTHEWPASNIVAEGTSNTVPTLSHAVDNELTFSVHGASVDSATTPLVKRNRPYHVAAYRDGTTIGLYNDGVDQGTDTISGSPETGGRIRVGGYAAGLVVQGLAVYTDWIGAAAITAHVTAGTDAFDGQTTDERVGEILDEIGWPAADRDIDTGYTAGYLGPSDHHRKNALEALREVERTEQGALYCDHSNGGVVRFRQRYAPYLETPHTTSQATLTDVVGASTLLRYTALTMEDSPVYNDVTVSWSGGQVRVTDTDSIDTYTRRTREISTAATTAAQAQAIAEDILVRYKDRRTHITQPKLVPTADVDWTEVLTRKVGDQVTIRRHPQAVGTAFTDDYLVAGISHTFASGQDQWETVYRLDPVIDSQPVWTWGDDSWNGTKVWAH